MEFKEVNNKECSFLMSVRGQCGGSSMVSHALPTGLAWECCTVLAAHQLHVLTAFFWKLLASFSLWNMHLPLFSPLLYYSTD